MIGSQMTNVYLLKIVVCRTCDLWITDVTNYKLLTIFLPKNTFTGINI